MPDITMCEGTDCPLREDCYRFRVQPNEYRQAYFTNPPYDYKQQECSHYWKTNEFKNEESKVNKDK